MSLRLLHRLLLCVGLPALFALVVCLAPKAAGETKPREGREGDVALFKSVVHRMEDGQPYYQAFGTELRARHYPARSVFNWRQPFLYRMLASVSSNVSQLLLIVLSLALLVATRRTLGSNRLAALTITNATALIALDGIGAPPATRYFTELWAGAFIGLSALSYARHRTVRGALWGLLALFIRELAAPYCALAAFLAVRGRRWREIRVWAAGAMLYGIYYARHSLAALQHMQSGDVSHVQSWLYWGGLPFLLKVWQFNGLLLVAPSWVLGLVVVAIVIASWAPHVPLHLRLSVLLYSVLFLAVGQPFNEYWGLLTAPIIALWLAYAPGGFRVLLSNADLITLSAALHAGPLRCATKRFLRNG